MDSFDEIARRLQAEGVGDIPVDLPLEAVRSQAVMASCYWLCLRACGVPEDEITVLTLEWMRLCSGEED